MKLQTTLKTAIFTLFMLIFAGLSGFSPLLSAYADDGNNSNQGEVDMPGGSQTENPNPPSGLGDFDDNNERNDFTSDDPKPNPPSHITNPGGNNNNQNSSQPAPERPSDSSNTNNSQNSSPAPQNNAQPAPRGSSDASSQPSSSNSDTNSDSATTSDADDTDNSEDLDSSDTSTETSVSNSDEETSTTSPVTADLGSLLWIFFGVVVVIVILVGITAFFVDRYSKKHQDQADQLL